MDCMDLDTVSSPLFIYRPLSERHFRLLTIYPGSPDDPVSASLFSTSIDDPPGYDGLSYVWGEPLPVKSISCNGVTVDVTSNLFWALVRARYLTTPRVVWADALCINQRDVVVSRCLENPKAR